jgi:DNA-nicking Smr family endonuclease
MKKTKPSGFHVPFHDLSGGMKNRMKSESPVPAGLPAPPKLSMEPEDEKTLFLKAMADVKPLSKKNTFVQTPVRPKPPEKDPDREDLESLDALRRLVDQGRGFAVSSTPEYMEGTGPNIHPEISKKLHRGKFSVQAHLDLHGMTVSMARAEFDGFLKHALANNLRTLLIIHGRGLSSISEPVLKTKVYEWLTRGSWRRWIIAFSSARPVDGGPGATYVLLRKSPLMKKIQKKHKK